MFQMVARFRQIIDGAEWAREHPAYSPLCGVPLPDEGSIVEIVVPGIANPEMKAVRDESGLTIGWSCRLMRSDDLPPPVAPAPVQADPAIVSEIAVASASADVIRVDFKLKRRAA